MPSFFAARRVNKQIAEIPRTLGLFHGFADVVYIGLILQGVRHIRHKARVTAVQVLLAPKQCCRLIKPC
ncbi:hypothetical protein D3C71_1838940 [compost metagenome]